MGVLPELVFLCDSSSSCWYLVNDVKVIRMYPISWSAFFIHSSVPRHPALLDLFYVHIASSSLALPRTQLMPWVLRHYVGFSLPVHQTNLEWHRLFFARTWLTAIIPIVDFEFSFHIWIHHIILPEASCWVVVSRMLADKELFSSQIATFDVCRNVRLWKTSSGFHCGDSVAIIVRINSWQLA